MIYHSLSTHFLPTLSNTYGFSCGLKILENKYFLCFLFTCCIFTVGSKQCPSFSCLVSQLSCRVFQRDNFRLWGLTHFKLVNCGYMNMHIGSSVNDHFFFPLFLVPVVVLG